MRLLLWLVLCLSLAGLLTIVTIQALWWWMKRVARRVGLVRDEREERRARMVKPALLTEEELAAWREIERGYKKTAEADD